MTNKQLDTMLRYAAQKEDFIMSEHMETRLIHSIQAGGNVNVAKRFTPRMVVVVAIIIMLLAGIAIAASNWGILDFFSERDQNNQPIPNPYLADKVQTIGSVHQADNYRIEVYDMLCDREIVAMTWSIRNDSVDENLYFLCEVQDTTGKVNIHNVRGYVGAQAVLLKPGEDFDAAYHAFFDGLIEDDTLELSLEFTVLAHVGEVIAGDDYFTTDHVWDVNWSDEEKEQRRVAYLEEDQANTDAYNSLRKGNPDTLFMLGVMAELPYGFEGTGNTAKDLVDSGLMRLVETWSHNVSAVVSTEVASALPDWSR